MTSMKYIDINARAAKTLAAKKHPFEPALSYNNPPMYGPSPTASVVPSMKYPNASPKRFFGSIAVAMVTIALADAPNPIPWMNRTINSNPTLSTRKYSRQDMKWMLMNISAVFFHPIFSSALPEYILEHNPPKIYIPETSPAIVAVEPKEVAYSVTVDINAYMTSAVNSNAPNIKKKGFVNIFS